MSSPWKEEEVVYGSRCVRIGAIVAGDPGYRNIVIGDTVRRVTPEAAEQLARDIMGATAPAPALGFNWPTTVTAGVDVQKDGVDVAAKVAAFHDAGRMFTAPLSVSMQNDFVAWSTGAVRRDEILRAEREPSFRLVTKDRDSITIPEADVDAVLAQLRGGKLA